MTLAMGKIFDEHSKIKDEDEPMLDEVDG